MFLDPLLQADPVNRTFLLGTIRTLSFGGDTLSIMVDDMGRGAADFLGSAHLFRPGRYVFQAKHHGTRDRPPSVPRGAVVADFDSEVTKNVLLETSLEPVDHFFLVTNVPGSRDAVTKIDEKRRDFNRQRPQLYTDVLWQEHVIAWLDQFPAVWRAFPEIFPGGQAPILAEVAGTPSEELPRSLRLALAEQYRRDRVIRFKQITLEQPLSKLFVDLDVRASHFVQQVALPLSAFSTGVQVPPSDSGEVLIDSSGTQYEER